ncbi:MAG: hypothetical protein H6729_02950 [Deltaproteobacteria bacterium]|nr:hypothetical protein [Deltaproteobacteria bacterium]
MTPPSDRGGPALAIGRVTGRSEPNQAEVIDLVHLPRGTRPTPIAYLDYEEVERCRHLNCDFYQSCLAFASHVRWRSFHCRQCPLSPERVHNTVRGATHEPSPGLASVIDLR